MPKYPREMLTHVIQALTTPFQDEPPYADEFYTAVGRVVLLWGKLEQTLDNWIVTAITIEARTSRRQLRSFKVPLKSKLELLKAVYSECKVLRPFKDEVRVVADTIGELGEQRHLIVHSNWRGFDDGPPPKLRMRHIGHRGGIVKISSVTPSMDDLSRLSLAFHATTSKILQMHLSTSELVDPAMWEKAKEQARAGGPGFPPADL